jgi:hypothetical protein
LSSFLMAEWGLLKQVSGYLFILHFVVLFEDHTVGTRFHLWLQRRSRMCQIYHLVTFFIPLT